MMRITVRAGDVGKEQLMCLLSLGNVPMVSIGDVVVYERTRLLFNVFEDAQESRGRQQYLCRTIMDRMAELEVTFDG
jgi:hypothetical protein